MSPHCGPTKHPESDPGCFVLCGEAHNTEHQTCYDECMTAKDNQASPGPGVAEPKAEIQIKRKFGGKQLGTGRRPTEKTVESRARLAALQGHFDEPVDVKTKIVKNGRIVEVRIKKPRVLVALEKLFELGVQGDANALDKWLNRAVGKPTEADQGDGVDPEEQHMPSPAALAAADAYVRALKELSSTTTYPEDEEQPWT